MLSPVTVRTSQRSVASARARCRPMAGDDDAATEQPDAVCGACKKTMMTGDGQVRKRKDIWHTCEICNEPLHSAVLCKLTWFPQTAGLRMFCCKQHLLDYNAKAKAADQLPVRRIDPCIEEEEEVSSVEEDTDAQAPAAAPAAAVVESSTGNDNIDKNDPPPVPQPTPLKPQPQPVPQRPEPQPQPQAQAQPEPEPEAEPEPQPEPPVPEEPTQSLFKNGDRVQVNFVPKGESWYGGIVGG
eukprot:6190966-Pleurochrysis_carterae.AAC.1